MRVLSGKLGIFENIRRSIPAKVLLSLLTIEILLLAVTGTFYSSRFNQEIDRRIADKLALPGTLMNQRALPYDRVKNLESLADLVQAKVVDAFIFEQKGNVFFTSVPAREGKPYTDFLSQEERDYFKERVHNSRQFVFQNQSGEHFISTIHRLTANGTDLGGLYIRISANAVKQSKIQVIVFFCIGAALTIVVTTLISAYVVQRLFVPRIINSSQALQQFAEGDFTARITDHGDLDQLGELMLQVNSLLEKIEENTLRLQSLNKLADTFLTIERAEEILQIAEEQVNTFLPGISNTGGVHAPVHFTLQVKGKEISRLKPKVRFVPSQPVLQLSKADENYVNAVSSMVESTLERISAFRRITEAEEKYRELFMTALEGIFRAREDGELLDANPAMAEIFGYASAGEMIESDESIVSRYASVAGYHHLLRLLENEGKVEDYEILMRRRDGSIFPVSFAGRIFWVKESDSLVIEGRIIDISERKRREQEAKERLAADAAMQAKMLLLDDLQGKNQQLQDTLEELKRTQQQLVQSEKMAAVGMTASGVAHDLNNILAGVISYPELLLASLPDDSSVRTPLEAILASGRRAAAVVDDLLTLAKGCARVKQTVNFHSLVSEYLISSEFQTLMRQYPNVQVNAEDRSGDAEIDCSPVHIQKVIMNLVMNAVEAVAFRGGNVNVLTSYHESVAQEASWCILEVHDDGQGIAEEDRVHIFEPFYTRKVMGKKGTGLGLTVVWNVIKEHEGQITLESGPEGTTFHVWLPKAKERLVQQNPPDESIELNGTARVLIVDDEPLQRDIGRQMLTIFGYEVATVASGEEAIEYLQRESADIVILDMLMPPGLNGLQTYKTIIETNPGQKVILVSGYSNSSDVSEALELGVGCFIKKPYSMKQIAQAVTSQLTR